MCISNSISNWYVTNSPCTRTNDCMYGSHIVSFTVVLPLVVHCAFVQCACIACDNVRSLMSVWW